MNLDKIKSVYLIGIGGIGMSALARYFNIIGKKVSGYDRTPTSLTDELIVEGIKIHFEDKPTLIPDEVLKHKKNSLIIYTPAIPHNHYEFNYFVERHYNIMKRAEVLGNIFSGKKGIAIAGTHGKTTTSTMVAHLLRNSELDCNAFLGGISKNHHSNLLLSASSNYIVAEADEFDRSFLKLFPYLAIITSVDADHLDIYGSKEEVLKTFNQFACQISVDGILIYKKGIALPLKGLNKVNTYTYSVSDKADFYPDNIKLIDGLYSFDLVTPMETIKDLKLGLPGLMNLENSIAASAAAYLLKVNSDELRAGLSSFSGVKRRFDFQIKTEKLVYIDDYAHHPEELKACINSTRKMFAGRKITGIFQPHLYSRTRDFADGFAESLSLLDELILLDIYPARELPIDGVSSEILFKNITIKNKTLCNKSELLNILKDKKIDVLLTMGAGDIDTLVKPICEMIG